MGLAWDGWTKLEEEGLRRRLERESGDRFEMFIINREIIHFSLSNSLSFSLCLYLALSLFSLNSFF